MAAEPSRAFAAIMSVDADQRVKEALSNVVIKIYELVRDLPADHKVRVLTSALMLNGCIADVDAMIKRLTA